MSRSKAHNSSVFCFLAGAVIHEGSCRTLGFGGLAASVEAALSGLSSRPPPHVAVVAVVAVAVVVALVADVGSALPRVASVRQ